MDCGTATSKSKKIVLKYTRESGVTTKIQRPYSAIIRPCPDDTVELGLCTISVS